MRVIVAALPSRFLPLLLLAFCLPLAARAGFKPGPGWPEVSTPFYHAATPAQAAARSAVWRRQPGHSIQGYRDTGSMRPVLHGGRELLAMEACHPDTPLARGQMVVYNRGDLPAVLHYIAALSRDGRHLYLSGVGSRYSDGWFHRDTVAFVLREIITLPAPNPITVAARPGPPAPAIEATPPPVPRS